MAKQGTATATPKLRFPEFRGAAAWEKKPLSTLLDYERPEKYIVTDTAYLESGTPVLTANKSFVLGYTNETDGVYSSLPAIIFDDFTTDKKYVDFPFKVKSSAIKILQTKADNSLRLIFELMCGIKFDAKEHKRYYISEYQNLEIALPERLEQQKIADCLTSLDEVIAAQGRKVEALKAHKRGLMQQLFPRDGETRPRLRFPEFRDAPEWSEETVDCLVDTITPSKKLPTAGYATQGRYPIVDQSPLPVCGWTDDQEAVITPPQPVIIFGDHTCVLKLQTSPFVQGADGIKILLPRSRVSSEFLYQSLHVRKIESTEYKRHYSELKEKRVRLPSRHSGEQDKVANLLGEIDTKIIAEVAQLAALKTHKQGLMQQLFPAPEAIEA